jgi:hypothetical protein
MPKQYEEIRDSYIKSGKPVEEAKKLAAMTYNAHRKPGVAPVTGHSEGLGDRLIGKRKK